MGILDGQLSFSDVQDLGSASVGTTISTNVVDITAQVNDLASRVSGNLGESDIVLTVTVEDEDFTSGGSATLAVAIQTHSTVTTTSGTTLLTSPAVAVASLVDGYEVWQVRLPFADYNRYLGLGYVVAAAAMTAGKITAKITLEGVTPVGRD